MYFFGETFVRGGCAGCSRISHFPSQCIADRIDETGLSSSDRPIEQNSEVTDFIGLRLISPHVLQTSLIVSVKIWLNKTKEFKIIVLTRLFTSRQLHSEQNKSFSMVPRSQR